jgi:cytochrome c556
MNKLTAALLALVVFLFAATAWLWCGLARAEARLAALESAAQPAAPFHLGLGEVMGYQQRWLDKAGLAASAGNWAAAAFYAGELRETVDDLIAAKVVRDGQDLSALAQSALPPALDALADAIARQNAALFASRYANLVGACNTCHAETRVPFIHVTGADDARGRWNQVFAPATIQK